MIDQASNRPRAEWPTPISPQRVRKRQQQHPSYSHRRYSPSASPPALSSSSSSSKSRHSSSRPSWNIQLAIDTGSFSNYDLFDYQNTASSASVSAGNTTLNLTAAQTAIPNTQWMSNYPNATIPQSISPEDPVSPEFPDYIGQDGATSLSLQTGNLGGFDMSWSFINQASTGNMNTAGFDDMPISRSDVANYSSMIASASTMSASSENFMFPISPIYGSPAGPSPSLLGLTLPDYMNQGMIADSTAIQRTESFSTPLSVTSAFAFENQFTMPTAWDFNAVNDMFPMPLPQPSVTPLMEAPDLESEGRYIRSQARWNSNGVPGNTFGDGVAANPVAFDPESSPLGSLHDDSFGIRNSSTNNVYGPEPLQTNWFDESDSSTTYSNTLYTPSHGSPASHHSPHSQTRSPHSHSRSPHSHTHSPRSQASPASSHDASHHSHVFSAYPEPQKGKVTRGRVRPLTDKEKREARDVRQAGACWACHLSKIKCSPCSSGSPCEQCTRLSGKRRFCLLPCFNDPVEMLDKFLVPDYMIRQYTVENTEKFIAKNASGFGRDEMIIRLSWGYRVPLKVTVVSLSVRGSTSVFRYQSQTYVNKDGLPTFTKKKSPPLGILPTSMHDKHEEYKRYVEQIARRDLAQYVKIAYEPEESDLAKRLLQTVCQFYTAGVNAGDEYELLREAIEIHIACSILERSLILDDESTKLVEGRLGEEYPPDSAPRCAQRQIKVAFFMTQQDRIKEVLREWGQLMWTSNRATTNERKWAIGFSVLLVLTLVMDKTLGLSWCTYVSCSSLSPSRRDVLTDECSSQSRVKHGGKEAEMEKNEFQERVKVTQTNLFERCKEILHSKFKTRKGGKESFNPIRDGDGAWRGKVIDETIAGFVDDIRGVVQEFDQQVRSCRTRGSKNPREDALSLSPKVDESPYTDAARLASVFLDDFLEH
ncbi:fungal zn binuclear cluster domain containing protein [Rutstroemia sp. NJR-2017a WRK4]|nr:fungal zn binuclear cluster domain containing protein [Rutstroemia sp. NJR-2017a WRK4]